MKICDIDRRELEREVYARLFASTSAPEWSEAPEPMRELTRKLIRTILDAAAAQY